MVEQRSDESNNLNHNGTIDGLLSLSLVYLPVLQFVLLVIDYVIMFNMRSCSLLCVLAAAVSLTESFSPLAASPFGKPTALLLHKVATRSSFTVRLSATDDDDSSSEPLDADTGGNDGSGVPSAPVREILVPKIKRVDPLLASLTRFDPSKANAVPTRKVPILGEVAMDKSLYLIVPAVTFAILGLLTSIYVGFNSQDAFSAALAANPVLQSAQSAPDGEGCRGICSTQQADLEDLRVFMNSLGKGK